MSHVLIIGGGDIGRRVAQLCQQQGQKVSALCHRPAGCEQLQALGITPIAGDLDDSDSLNTLPADHALLYYFAPPPDHGQSDTRVRNFLHALGEQAPARLVYISTTAVYGDCQGAWVTEQTPVKLHTDRARRRRDAEQQLLAFGERRAVPVVILRVGGIYGPGRFPGDAVRRQRPIVREEEAPYSNRIHADDLAQVCLAAMGRGRAGSIYNAVDGEQSTMSRYFKAVAERLGLPPPPEISWQEAQTVLSPGMLTYLRESRRIDNRKMLTELGVVLRYPTLEQGLLHCL